MKRKKTRGCSKSIGREWHMPAGVDGEARPRGKTGKENSRVLDHSGGGGGGGGGGRGVCGKCVGKVGIGVGVEKGVVGGELGCGCGWWEGEVCVGVTLRGVVNSKHQSRQFFSPPPDAKKGTNVGGNYGRLG